MQNKMVFFIFRKNIFEKIYVVFCLLVTMLAERWFRWVWPYFTSGLASIQRYLIKVQLTKILLLLQTCFWIIYLIVNLAILKIMLICFTWSKASIHEVCHICLFLPNRLLWFLFEILLKLLYWNLIYLLCIYDQLKNLENN